jgi:hypothetical protein
MITTEKEIRIYNCSDVVMFTTIATILENAKAHKTFLIAKRSTWADPFFSDTETRIDNLLKKYLGVDSAKDLRNATQALKEIQTKALKVLGDVKVQIEEDFIKTKVRQKEILNNLGFAAYYTEASGNKSQEALVNLLFQFKKNMIATLKTEITAKGTAAAQIDEIISYADTLNDANVSQETFKINRPSITEEAVIAFNEIYTDVKSIGKIAARFFKDQETIKQTFSFTKIATAQKVALKAKKAIPKPPAT